MPCLGAITPNNQDGFLPLGFSVVESRILPSSDSASHQTDWLRSYGAFKLSPN
ncbi:hypothetical protein [Gloeocapsopsis dulcis]|uniref:hypothetical protein n=1 Tax=Gloeocapsopsis dulcis TaxID=2859516 RepID=UPI0012DAE7ED|nr:hypothetical protein [Gloeocapsopsis dulcis]